MCWICCRGMWFIMFLWWSIIVLFNCVLRFLKLLYCIWFVICNFVFVRFRICWWWRLFFRCVSWLSRLKLLVGIRYLKFWFLLRKKWNRLVLCYGCLWMIRLLVICRFRKFVNVFISCWMSKIFWWLVIIWWILLLISIVLNGSVLISIKLKLLVCCVVCFCVCVFFRMNLIVCCCGRLKRFRLICGIIVRWLVLVSIWLYFVCECICIWMNIICN